MCGTSLVIVFGFDKASTVVWGVLDEARVSDSKTEPTN